MFLVAWLPMQTFSMVVFLYPELRRNNYQSSEYNFFVGAYFTCHWLSMAHSCFNPLIYCFMNDKFRSDLHDLVCKRRIRQAATGLTGTNQHHKVEASLAIRIGTASCGARSVSMAPSQTLAGGGGARSFQDSVRVLATGDGANDRRRSLTCLLQASPLEPKACRTSLAGRAGFPVGPASL